MILPVGKDNATVVMSNEDYSIKIKSILSESVYKKSTSDPTNKTERRITYLTREADYPEDVMKKLTLHVSVPPRIHGLPKIHKEGVLLRPIINCISSPTHNLAKYLAGLLKPLVGHSMHHIINTEMFIHKLSDIKLQKTDILVSFDVTSYSPGCHWMMQYRFSHGIFRTGLWTLSCVLTTLFCIRWHIL
jgi:hypothetical protein